MFPKCVLLESSMEQARFLLCFLQHGEELQYVKEEKLFSILIMLVKFQVLNWLLGM